MPILILPVRNLHGSDDLLTVALKCRSLVRQLILAVEDAAPNGRDYYIDGNGALAKAVQERKRITDGLAALAADLLVLGDDAENAQPEESKADAIQDFPLTPGVYPAVHSNGTSPGGLKDPAKFIFKLTQTIEESFGNMIPNMRDYADVATWVAAREQHARRVAMVRNVGGYFLQIAVAVGAASRAA